MPEEFDLLLRGGRVIDGTGRPAFEADVAVRGGKVCHIGALPADAAAKQTLDVRGHLITPGFIDIHTHADIALLARPAHLPKIMQGVTTEVFTNCGLGFAPVNETALQIQRQYIAGLFGDDGNDSAPPDASNISDNAAHEKVAAENEGSQAADIAANVNPLRRVRWNWRTVAEFLAQFESGGVGANVAYLIPHGAVRVSAMGMAERTATPAEVRVMQDMVTQGMEEGAWGLSTGVWYAPMRAADRNELVTLCRTAGFFATHQRDYGDSIFAATEESLAIAREAGARLQIAHLQMNGPANAGRANDLLARLDQARRDGVDITCDTYPYLAGSTQIQTLLPAWAVDGGPDALLRRLSEEDTRTRIAETMFNRSLADWQKYTLVGAQSAANRGLEGLTFDAAATARGMSVPEWVCAVLEEDHLRACYIHQAAHEGNVRTIMQWEGQMVGSDGLHLPGKTHPRLYGTFPRVLSHYVREERVITLEEAVHKMTGKPAARLGLKQRGLLQPGYAADLVVFDPTTVCDTATFEDPLRYPTGIPYVFVNGVAAKFADKPTGALAGKVLRRI